MRRGLQACEPCDHGELRSSGAAGRGGIGLQRPACGHLCSPGAIEKDVTNLTAQADAGRCGAARRCKSASDGGLRRSKPRSLRSCTPRDDRRREASNTPLRLPLKGSPYCSGADPSRASRARARRRWTLTGMPTRSSSTTFGWYTRVEGTQRPFGSRWLQVCSWVRLIVRSNDRSRVSANWAMTRSSSRMSASFTKSLSFSDSETPSRFARRRSTSYSGFSSKTVKLGSDSLFSDRTERAYGQSAQVNPRRPALCTLQAGHRQPPVFARIGRWRWDHVGCCIVHSCRPPWYNKGVIA